ncbi:RNA-binding S4 domain-containing protein [uncultured Desulfobacter sp.]|uniref:RNA-binding S4 domain-containing protein n=1 Tax=uncultured Desulfobacter sp. TaxID=240139 RepID=UPI002AAA9430|nr:RNA-binding S4 domain-containing protein [uncultured Desulfobacter sp.]
MTEKRTVYITRATVELYKVLKFENLASSGGEAKHMIADGLVRVNGQIETRKRKQIFPGDVIEFYDITLDVCMEK